MNTRKHWMWIPAAPVLALAACSSQPGADPSTSGEAPLTECHADGCDAGAPLDGAPGDSSASGGDDASSRDFRSCQLDDDCVAVPAVGCCQQGWLAAVNRNEVDAYEASFTCTVMHPICPMYRIVDHRVAECEHITNLCVMVPIDEIYCAGFINNPHQCPDGYECHFTTVPDIPGRCVKPS